ncbi:MAG: diaminopimelate epimerase [Planctomycetota bacterium]
MRFTKMQGAGNDYVYVNGFSESCPADLPKLVREISDRRFGVGGDGLILVLPSQKADARMRMFNADGSEAEMCGNGLRCVAKLVVDSGIASGPELRIETLAGVLTATIEQERGRESLVRVDMGEPRLAAAEIPTTLSTTVPSQALETDSAVVEAPLLIDSIDDAVELSVTCVSMGNPHAVVFVEQATDELVLGLGPKIERHLAFPAGVNVEFVEVLSQGEVRQRTWERGSGETLACGTGAAAVCVAGVLTGRTNRELLVHLRGGDLRMHWEQDSGSVQMVGPAVEVFTGDWPA